MTDIKTNTLIAAELPALGQPLASGIFFARYLLNGQERALILLPDEFEGKYGEYGVKIEGANSYTDGEANTLAMAEAGSEIAKKALELGGHIPSPLEATLMMAAKIDGLIELRNSWHWLSMQFSAPYACSFHFEVGYQDGNDNLNEFFVRPVRSLPIQ